MEFTGLLRLISITLTLFALLTCGCGSGDARSAESTPAPPPAAGPMPTPEKYPEYAGSESCRDCHPEAYEEWRFSHHAGAQRLLSREIDDPAFKPTREIHHGTQTARAELRDGQYTLVTMGPDGKDQPFHPDQALGVFPLWQYLIPFDGGRWQLTELAFDPANKEWFNVYNDENRQYYEWGHWSQRGMNWNSMCATCHTTAFQKNYQPDTDTYQSTFLELGVGCEQCHGSMRRHVDFQNDNPDGGYFGDRTIKKLTPDQMLHICASCHTRRGNVTGSFQAGDEFLDHFEPVLPDLTNLFYPDGQIWDEDFEFNVFMLSYMHAAGVRCINCHSPHTGKRLEPGNQLCLRCHQAPMGTKIAIDPAEHSHHPPDKPGFLCTDCHMPQTVYMARHWRHDHGQTIPDPLLTREHGIPNACTRCHEEEGVDWAIKYVEEWYGDRMERRTRQRARLLARLKEGDHAAAPELLEMLETETNPTWRAVCAKFLSHTLFGAPDEAVRNAVRDAMVRLVDDPSPLPRAAAIDALEPIAPMVAERLTPRLYDPYRLVRVKAAWALRRQVDQGSATGRELLAWLKEFLDQPTGALRWATYLTDVGQAATALPWLRKATEWDRGSAPIRYNYSVILSQAGRFQEAIDQLTQAARLAPTEAIYPYALGLQYAEMGRLSEARDALKRAVELDGSHGRYWYNLALAENQLGSPQAAVDALVKAEELEPQVADYPFARATILHHMQRPGDAKDALERALRIEPNHQQAQEMLKALQYQPS